MSIESELSGRAALTRAYFEMLQEQGFSHDEAFALVRDWSAAFNWFAMVSGEEPPAWLGAPTSSVSSTSTGGDLVHLRPNTRDQ